MKFLAGVGERKIHQLALMFHLVALKQDDVLFEEWEFDELQGNPLYFLYRGSVRVIVTDKNNKPQQVCPARRSVPERKAVR